MWGIYKRLSQRCGWWNDSSCSNKQLQTKKGWENTKNVVVCKRRRKQLKIISIIWNCYTINCLRSITNTSSKNKISFQQQFDIMFVNKTCLVFRSHLSFSSGYGVCNSVTSFCKQAIMPYNETSELCAWLIEYLAGRYSFYGIRLNRKVDIIYIYIYIYKSRIGCIIIEHKVMSYEI